MTSAFLLETLPELGTLLSRLGPTRELVLRLDPKPAGGVGAGTLHVDVRPRAGSALPELGRGVTLDYRPGYALRFWPGESLDASLRQVLASLTNLEGGA